jgi:hypothetical protein
VLSDYVAYLAVQQNGADVARSALPHAPIQPADGRRISGDPFDRLRAWLGAELRRLADDLEPSSHSGIPMSMPRR